jgi:cobalt-zinc-cadmium efflux system membrane fusion protein
VPKTIGDQVRNGEILVGLESRELADAKTDLLAARERLVLAQSNSDRETQLWQKKITSEREYIEANNALVAVRITLGTAEQKLHALGFSEAEIKAISKLHDDRFAHYEIRAPISGTIIEKHVSLGETVQSDSPVFTIADLSTVWVDLNVYQKDLARIRKKQSVVIKIGHGIPDVAAEILWVAPIIDEATRTAKARVLLPNPNGERRPGMFVTANVAVSSAVVPVRVPKTALQSVEEQTVVFIQTTEGFEARPVKIGRKNATHVEIVSGLDVGQSYVSQGAFTLKAQLSKGAFGDGHGH